MDGAVLVATGFLLGDGCRTGNWQSVVFAGILVVNLALRNLVHGGLKELKRQSVSYVLFLFIAGLAFYFSYDGVWAWSDLANIGILSGLFALGCGVALLVVLRLPTRKQIGFDVTPIDFPTTQEKHSDKN